MLKNSAFGYCTALEEINFPGSLTAIGECAFIECTALTEVTLPEGLTVIGERAFGYCISLSEVVFPNSLVSVGDCAFYDTALTEVFFAEELKSIESGAFNFCSFLTKVVLPDSLVSMANNAFSMCGSLNEFQVRDANKEGYTAIDSVLYFYDKSSDTYQLIAYPKGKEGTSYSIYKDTVSIGTSAFSGCSGLTEIIFPDGVTTIMTSAFEDCVGLEKVVFPKMLKTLESCAFGYCENLSAAYIYGNPPETEDDDVFEEADNDFTIYYSSTSSGWTTPVWNGYLTLPFDPIIASGTVGESLAWSFDGIGELTITGTGAMPEFASADEVPWNTYAAQIKQIHIGDGVTSVSGLAFDGCTVLKQIRFVGNAPSFAENAFSGIKATAYYPVDNAAWTEAVMQNYGGTITWESYETSPILTTESKKVYKGAEFTIDLILGNAKPATSLALTEIAVDPDYAELLEIEWLLKDASLKDTNLTNRTAAIAYDSAVDMNGAIFRLHLKARDNAGDVSCAIRCTAVLEINNVRTTVKVNADTIQIMDYIRGDTNSDSLVTSADAIYLLRYTILPERYPLGGGDADYNGDGEITAEDAVYLLYHALMPEKYPVED